MYVGRKVPVRNNSQVEGAVRLVGEVAADAIDWRSKGAVTPVKNQGQCGSCWSFSTTGSLEGALFLKTGKITPLSEQNIMDCDSVDQSCNGGLMDNAFEWIEKNGGVCSEADYPYEGADGSCKTSCTKVPGTTIKSYVDVAKTEDALMAAVAQQPTSIAVNANMFWQLYSGGVLSALCGAKLDHGVLAVGYGTDGKDYWKVKNSWGSSWGESGYIRVQRGKGGSGECGILTSASYPVLA
jgi:C1A family cysteine protease